MFKQLLMFTYGDTSHNLLDIAIYIKTNKLFYCEIELWPVQVETINIMSKVPPDKELYRGRLSGQTFRMFSLSYLNIKFTWR